MAADEDFGRPGEALDEGANPFPPERPGKRALWEMLARYYPQGATMVTLADDPRLQELWPDLAKGKSRKPKIGGELGSDKGKTFVKVPAGGMDLWVLRARAQHAAAPSAANAADAAAPPAAPSSAAAAAPAAARAAPKAAPAGGGSGRVVPGNTSEAAQWKGATVEYLEKHLLRCHVSVWWAGPRQFYEGRIVGILWEDVPSPEGPLLLLNLLYDDNQEEWIQPTKFHVAGAEDETMVVVEEFVVFIWEPALRRYVPDPHQGEEPAEKVAADAAEVAAAAAAAAVGDITVAAGRAAAAPAAAAPAAAAAQPAQRPPLPQQPQRAWLHQQHVVGASRRRLGGSSSGGKRRRLAEGDPTKGRWWQQAVTGERDASSPSTAVLGAAGGSPSSAVPGPEGDQGGPQGQAAAPSVGVGSAGTPAAANAAEAAAGTAELAVAAEAGAATAQAAPAAQAAAGSGQPAMAAQAAATAAAVAASREQAELEQPAQQQPEQRQPGQPQQPVQKQEHEEQGPARPQGAPQQQQQKQQQAAAEGHQPEQQEQAQPAKLPQQQRQNEQALAESQQRRQGQAQPAPSLQQAQQERQQSHAAMGKHGTPAASPAVSPRKAPKAQAAAMPAAKPHAQQSPPQQGPADKKRRRDAEQAKHTQHAQHTHKQQQPADKRPKSGEPPVPAAKGFTIPKRAPAGAATTDGRAAAGPAAAGGFTIPKRAPPAAAAPTAAEEGAKAAGGGGEGEPSTAPAPFRIPKAPAAAAGSTPATADRPGGPAGSKWPRSQQVEASMPTGEQHQQHSQQQQQRQQQQQAERRRPRSPPADLAPQTGQHLLRRSSSLIARNFGMVRWATPASEAVLPTPAASQAAASQPPAALQALRARLAAAGPWPGRDSLLPAALPAEAALPAGTYHGRIFISKRETLSACFERSLFVSNSSLDLEGLQEGMLAVMHSLDERLVYGFFRVVGWGVRLDPSFPLPDFQYHVRVQPLRLFQPLPADLLDAFCERKLHPKSGERMKFFDRHLSRKQCKQLWALLQFYSGKLQPELDMRHRFGSAFGEGWQKLMQAAAAAEAAGTAADDKHDGRGRPARGHS
ncbi:hypothetical protein ABPG75_011629 [Micractinium tetrahymenae]